MSLRWRTRNPFCAMQLAFAVAAYIAGGGRLAVAQCSAPAPCPPCEGIQNWSGTRGGLAADGSGRRVINVGVATPFNGTLGEESAIGYSGIAATYAWNRVQDQCYRNLPYVLRWVGADMDVTVQIVAQIEGGFCAETPTQTQISLLRSMVDNDIDSSDSDVPTVFPNTTIELEHELGHIIGLDEVENDELCPGRQGIMDGVAEPPNCEDVPYTPIGWMDVGEVNASWSSDGAGCSGSQPPGSHPVQCYCMTPSGSQFFGQTEPANGGACNCSQCSELCDPGNGGVECDSGYCAPNGCCEPAGACQCTSSSGLPFFGATQIGGGCGCGCTEPCVPGQSDGCASGSCDDSGCCLPPQCGGALSCHSAECLGNQCDGNGCCLAGGGGTGTECTNIVTDKLTGKIRCDPPGTPCQSTSDCVEGWYCNYNYCTLCGLPCEPDDPECFCEMATYSGTSYCNCLASQGSPTNCGYGPWYNDYPAGCFNPPPAPGAGLCGQGVTTCYYGPTQCGGTGYGCDSNGCCTLTGPSCNPPSSFAGGVCPVDYAQVGDCCEKYYMCAENWFCNVDSDCAQYSDYSGNPYCVSGCCSNCAANYNDACGNCQWGQYTCDGTCVAEPYLPCNCDVNNPDDPSCGCAVGGNCGNCGAMDCQDNCQDPCPNQPGSSCGGCGTYESDGATCDDPCGGCQPDSGSSCGNCGSYQCNGSCDDPCECDPNQGNGCGTCGSVQCDGSCNDPCNGCYDQAGLPCGNCGSIQCDASCDDPCACDPNYGNGCGNCGTTNCDGSCSDPCS